MTTFLFQFGARLRRLGWATAIALMIVEFFFSTTFAQAATLSATPISISGNGVLTIAPGEVKEVTAVFQNSSDQTWKNDGPGYISLYTYEPKYRKSDFDPGTWLGPTQVKRIQEASVAPGKTATVAFELHAPAAVGDYTEVFQLASEDTAWIEGGKISLKIKVAEEPAEIVTESDSTDGYAGTVAVRSANKVKAQAGKSILFTVGFKNTGTKTWTSFGLTAPDLTLASSDVSQFKHSSWNGSLLATVAGTTVKPGEMAILSFSFTAPKINGSHTAKFQLQANETDVSDAFVEIPVEVTGGAGEAIEAPENENAKEIDESKIIVEPTIRVGVLIVDEETENEVVITSDQSDFTVENLDGDVLAELDAGDEVTAYVEDGRYYYEIDGEKEKSSSALRFVPEKDNAVMTVSNFDRRVTRGTANADNTFRNVLELRYNDYKERSWLINELPMEYYLKGLAETSNVSPLEFQKALLTAARTYGFYHWTHATKHAKEFFHVDAYADQVYNGYGQESRTPRLSEGVDTTRGQIVTYQGDIAITPYFSRSDGRTRDWSDVWYGEVPWAVSVSVPCDIGKTLWGHGVGMSASGALCMAKDGDDWETILKHFYTGVELETRWR